MRVPQSHGKVIIDETGIQAAGFWLQVSHLLSALHSPCAVAHMLHPPPGARPHSWGNLPALGLGGWEQGIVVLLESWDALVSKSSGLSVLRGYAHFQLEWIECLFAVCFFNTKYMPWV